MCRSVKTKEISYYKYYEKNIYCPVKLAFQNLIVNVAFVIV